MLKCHFRCHNVNDSSPKQVVVENDLEDGEISSEEDNETNLKKSTADRPLSVAIPSQIKDCQESKKKAEMQKSLPMSESVSNGAGIAEQKTEEKKTAVRPDDHSSLKLDSDKNSEQRKETFESSVIDEKHIEGVQQRRKSNETTFDRKSSKSLLEEKVGTEVKSKVDKLTKTSSSKSQRINEIEEKTGTEVESKVGKHSKTSPLVGNSSIDIFERNFNSEKEEALEAKSQEDVGCEKPKEKSHDQLAGQSCDQPTGQEQGNEDESMETQEQDSCPIPNHSRVTKTFQKIGSFSSEDSFGCFASSSKATDLPDDLTNVDTVELDSLIQEKRNLFKQLEEKQNRYLKKMKKSSADQVADDCIEYPKVISVTDQESETGQVLISVAFL